jgi:hypothetical protein
MKHGHLRRSVVTIVQSERRVDKNNETTPIPAPGGREHQSGQAENGKKWVDGPSSRIFFGSEEKRMDVKASGASPRVRNKFMSHEPKPIPLSHTFYNVRTRVHNDKRDQSYTRHTLSKSKELRSWRTNDGIPFEGSSKGSSYIRSKCSCFSSGRF